MSKPTYVAIYICDSCGEEIPTMEPGSMFGNYGSTAQGEKHCYPCCGKLDRDHMIAHGKITLYLVERSQPSSLYDNSDFMEWARLTNTSLFPQPGEKKWFVVNWPNSLQFRVRSGPAKGKHNIARRRYSVWFNGPDGFIWYGVQYGDNTELVHCKRTKQTVKGSNLPAAYIPFQPS